jgi:archaeal flagellin FlaB
MEGYVRRFAKFFRRLHRDERGITGLETAIILIAFVIVSSVFAFVVLSTGLVSAERGKQTVLAGLEKAQGNLELRGNVTATSSGTPAEVDNIIFNLSLAAAGRPVLLDPDADTNGVVINFIDAEAREAAVTYTVTVIQGDSDDLLEAGELFEITVAVPGTSELAINEQFSLEVIPPSGGTLQIIRTIPPQIEAVMELH